MYELVDGDPFMLFEVVGVALAGCFLRFGVVAAADVDGAVQDRNRGTCRRVRVYTFANVSLRERERELVYVQHESGERLFHLSVPVPNSK